MPHGPVARRRHIVDKDVKGSDDTPEHRRIAKLLADMYSEHKIMAPESPTMKANDEVDLFGAKSWAMGIIIHALLPPTLRRWARTTPASCRVPDPPGQRAALVQRGLRLPDLLAGGQGLAQGARRRSSC